MNGCVYVMNDGTRIELMHVPGRKKPVIALREPTGDCSGHAVFHDEESLGAFMAMFDRLLRPRNEVDE